MSKPICGPVVKTLRKQLDLTQAELADRAKISKDSLSRLEQGKQSGKAQRTRKALVAALGATIEVLTGDAPIAPAATAADSAPASTDRRQLNIRVDAAVRNALSLAALRYQTPVVRIIELAPLLFVLAAERSLERRRAKLAAYESAIDEADARAADFPHLPQSLAPAFFGYDAFHVEEDSIGQRDILAARLDKRFGARGDPMKGDYDEDYDNPFVCSLKEEATNPDVAEITRFSNDTIQFRVCRADALQLAGGEAELATGILDGWALLSEMPRGLLADDEGRLAWLRTKAAAHAEEEAARAKAFAETDWTAVLAALDGPAP